MHKQYRAFLFTIDKNKLLEAINRKEPHLNIQDSKIDIGINDAKGIYLPDKGVNYPISGKRLGIIKKLLETETVSIGEISDLTRWDNADISRAISKINKSFTEKLKVKDKLINRLDTGGYTLNKENFNINSEI